MELWDSMNNDFSKDQYVLHEAYRLLTGCLKSTSLAKVNGISGIVPPKHLIRCTYKKRENRGVSFDPHYL